jgi:hypothetical protein
VRRVIDVIHVNGFDSMRFGPASAALASGHGDGRSQEDSLAVMAERRTRAPSLAVGPPEVDGADPSRRRRSSDSPSLVAPLTFPGHHARYVVSVVRRRRVTRSAGRPRRLHVDHVKPQQPRALTGPAAHKGVMGSRRPGGRFAASSGAPRRRRVGAQPLAARAKPVSAGRLGLARSGVRPGRWAKRRDARCWRGAGRSALCSRRLPCRGCGTQLGWRRRFPVRCEGSLSSASVRLAESARLGGNQRRAMLARLRLLVVRSHRLALECWPRRSAAVGQ